MLPHPTLEKLEQLRLKGMARALRAQSNTPNIDQLNFMDRLGLLVDHEATARENARLKSRLRRAKLRQSACMEDLDYRASRGLDHSLMMHLAKCNWLRNHENVVVTRQNPPTHTPQNNSGNRAEPGGQLQSESTNNSGLKVWPVHCVHSRTPPTSIN